MNLEVENQKLASILHSMLGSKKSTPVPTENVISFDDDEEEGKKENQTRDQSIQPSEPTQPTQPSKPTQPSEPTQSTQPVNGSSGLNSSNNPNESAIQSLFDDNNVNSFSLFNFLPAEKDDQSTQQPSQDQQEQQEKGK